MRKSIAIIITSILVLSGCNKQQSVSDRLLNEVEKAIAINPDSASNLLKGISSPEKLDNKTFARWCMLSGKITSKSDIADATIIGTFLNSAGEEVQVVYNEGSKDAEFDL